MTKHHPTFIINLSALNTILKVLEASCKDINKVESVIKSIFERITHSNLSPNLQTFNIILNIYSTLGESEKLKQFFWNFPSQYPEIQPDVSSYTIFLKTLANHGTKYEVSSLWETIKEKKSIKPDIYLFNCLFRVFNDNSAKVNQLVAEMTQYGMCIFFLPEQVKCEIPRT